MSKTKVIVVEDEPIIAADLEMQLRKAGLEVLGTFESGNEVLDYLKKGDLPDTLLLDVQLIGALDGIDVANEINRLYKLPVIFLTSNTDSETFKRAKLTYPHAFLSKPFRIKDVLHAITLSIDNQESDNAELEFLSDRIFIRNRDALEKVLFDDILFVQAEGAYSKIVTKEKSYVLSQTLKKTEEKIVSKSLVRIHRSYIINIRNVDKITDGYVHIKNERIPVSRKQKDELLNLFKTL